MKRVMIPATLLAGGLLIACANVSPSTDDDTSALSMPSSLHLKQDGDWAAPATASAHVTYYGGPVIPNVKVHAVYWNSNVKYQTELDGFYRAITASPYLDWLTEYDTPTQKIGRGTFAGSIVDSQSGGAVSDSQIQTELAKLIDDGKLPSPTENDLFMVHFPAGVNVTASDGSESCQAFCAYHDTFTHKGKDVYYGVMPDLGGACDGGCGTKSQLDNTTATSSHELLESITDSAVGLAQSVGPPLAWYDQTNGEISDICVGKDATVAGYNVQLAWSNAAGACIAQKGSGSGCSCSGKSCGDDGCGNSCGTCASGQSCSADGKCQSPSTSCGESEPNDKAAQADAICSAGTMSGAISERHRHRLVLVHGAEGRALRGHAVEAPGRHRHGALSRGGERKAEQRRQRHRRARSRRRAARASQQRRRHVPGQGVRPQRRALDQVVRARRELQVVR